MARNTPPQSIWAAELIGLEAGRGSLRVRADAMDQLTEATSRAIAPEGSIALSPSPSEWPTRIATPAIPTSSAIARRSVSLLVLRKKISDNDMNTGIVAIITA